MAMTEPHERLQDDAVVRFNVPERIEHFLLAFTFIGLVVTGIPQMYALTGWAEWSINAMGGIETVRIIHRVMAAGMMAVSIYHGGSLTYKLFVLRMPPYLLPTWQDAKDLVAHFKVNLGFTDEHPKMERFNFEDKMEYWAVVWGTAVMVITGFMLWNPIATTSVLPGEAIPAALAAHGGEALLATLAIIIFHFYNVFSNLNFSIFTGKMSRKVYEEKHGGELEDIEKGRTWQPPTQEQYRKRMRIFVPWATIMFIVLTAGLVWFVTFEQTAITTLPQ